MREIYQNIQQGFGTGLGQFYAQVAQHYLGIRRKETTDFLKHQGDYQLTRTNERHSNKTILAKTPNERWELDCINMEAYPDNHQRFILTIVDVFSGKVWLRPLWN